MIVPISVDLAQTFETCERKRNQIKFMAKEFRFYGIKEANADIKATTDAINPLLTSSKITTIEVNGRPVPATSDDVPNALKVLAYAGVAKEGSGDQQMSQMAANNNILAEQAKEFQARAVTAETGNGTLIREKTDLEGKLSVERACTERLTAENAELITLRKAANTEAGRVTGEMNALNTELSRRCLEVGCLADLRDEKNELLPSTATPEQRQAAAEKVPAADKLKALCGAVNAAIARTGVSITQIPSTGTSPAAKQLTATEKCLTAVAKKNRN